VSGWCKVDVLSEFCWVDSDCNVIEDRNMVGLLQRAASAGAEKQLDETHKLELAGKFSGITNKRTIMGVTKIAGKTQDSSQDVGKQTFERFQTFINSQQSSTNKIKYIKTEDKDAINFKLKIKDNSSASKYLDVECYFNKYAKNSDETYGYISVREPGKSMEGHYNFQLYKDRIDVTAFYNITHRNGKIYTTTGSGQPYDAVNKIIEGKVFFKDINSPYFIPKGSTEKDAVALKSIMQKMVADAKAKDKLPPVKRVKQPKVEKQKIQTCKKSFPIVGCIDNWPKSILPEF
jgi:hypothetical protein